MRCPHEHVAAQAKKAGTARLALAAALAIVIALSSSFSVAQNGYPNRLIKIIVPFAAGTTADLIPRLIAAELSKSWGQPIIIENRPGATGNIGAEMVARAAPDGYTLLSTAAPPLAINHLLDTNMKFDPSAFVPISLMTQVPNVLVINSKLPFKTLDDLVAYAKANPDKLTYASTGPGGTPTLAMELLKLKAGVQIRDIPYRTGTGPAAIDVLGGQVDAMFLNIAEGLAHIKSGGIRALGVGTLKRVPQLPDVPAIAEKYPGFFTTTWYAMAAPPKTPPAIVSKLSAAINETLTAPEVSNKLTAQSMQVVALSQAETAEFLKNEIERWREVIKAAGLALKK
ncbi:MAG: tripartite tricarboxylate transporter substrate binding protein [Hyphomicrobiales bacterium]|nr:tripartite tricarboxylate transporter substrate binding protein [Hyphomicrobiales bacterium]